MNVSVGTSNVINMYTVTVNFPLVDLSFDDQKILSVLSAQFHNTTFSVLVEAEGVLRKLENYLRENNIVFEESAFFKDTLRNQDQ